MAWTRWLQLGALAAATVALAAAAWLWQHRWQALRQAQDQHQNAAQRNAQAQSLLPELQRREQLATQVQDLSSRMVAQGFEPAHWGQRRIRQPLTDMSRLDAVRLLDALAPRGASSVLVAEQFELGVLSPEAGLFQTPAAGDPGVQLGLSATQFVQLHRPSGSRP